MLEGSQDRLPTVIVSRVQNSAGTKFLGRLKLLLKTKFLFSLKTILILLVVVKVNMFAGASAQAVTWTETDIGSPPTAGTFAYVSGSPPTYTINGSGPGFSNGYADVLGWASTPAAGNSEIEARVVSQSSTTAGAQSSLMMRQGFAQGSPMAAISVTVGAGITFWYRTTNGSPWTTVAGPASASLPVYLRLVRAGNTITGFYSTDNETWTSVGSCTTTNQIMPNLYYVGLGSSSNTSSLGAAVFDHLTYMNSVPQVASNLLLWLRGDVGVVSSSGKVSAWNDQSGNGNNATQATGSIQPSLVSGALNSGVNSAISFNGTSQYFSLANSLTNLSSGASVFVVLKPASTSATGDLLATGNASNANALISQTVGTNASLIAYNGSTSSSVTTTNTPLSTSSYALLEQTLAPGATAGTGTVLVNGTQDAQSTTMQNLISTSRSSNLVGTGIGLSNYFSGDIAEILVYGSPLSSSQRATVESYILSKYNIGNKPTLDAVVFSPFGGITYPGETVSLSQDQSAIPYFTSNGLTPTINNQWYNGVSLNPPSGEEFIALATAPFFNNSATSTTSFTSDPNTIAVPRNGLSLWLRSDTGVATTGTNVTQWGDSSGSLNTATQGTSADQPTLTTNAINGYPAVTFGSSSSLQIPAGMANLTSGASIFAVLKPTTVTAGARILDFGNGTASNNIYLDEPSTNAAALYALNGSSSTSVTSSSAITTGAFQLLEAVHTGSATATIYTNSVQGAQNTSMNNFNNITRSNNYIGQGSGGGNNFQGQIAELLFYNRGVSLTEKAQIEGYLFSRYQLPNYNSPAAPQISVASGTLTGPTQVAVEATAQATIFVTTNGTTPVPGTTPPYTGPINISYSQTLKAIAVVNGVSSSVATANYVLDATQWPAPNTSTTPLQINVQVPTPVIPQDANQH